MRTIFVVLFATFSVSVAGNCEFSRVNFREKATCRSGKLIEPYVSVKSTTEILDLSGNAISTLNNNAFYYVPIVMNLSLAHNTIHTIFLDAFAGLPHLKMLNLSHNFLETFDRRIVEKNTDLLVLDLSENNFINLNGEPFLISTSLEELHMRNSKLVHLVELFNELPKLKRLELGGNLLFSVNPQSFFTLTGLQYVNLQHNSYLKCDSTLQNLIEWFTAKDIEYETFKCVFPKKNSMFERMEMLPSLPVDEASKEDSGELSDLTDESESTESDYDLLLHHHNRASKLDEMYKMHNQRTSFRDCLEMNEEFVCHLLMNCKEEQPTKDKGAQEEENRTTKYLRHASLILFGLGIFLGTIVGGVCSLFCAKVYKDCDENLTVRRELRSIIRDARDDFSSYHEASRLNHPEEPQQREEALRQPRRPRRCTRPAPQPPVNHHRELVESNNAFHDFVTDLFSRRRRGHYLETIHHRGTNLIRQMSRSTLNLFQRSTSQRASAPASPSSLEDIQLVDTNYRATSSSGGRSETPPPPYKECLVVKS
ncbi:uncharacterized protein LOC129789018 [Lutzomyia longipalpis]|uniref:uncharacterized protein LOC129789018 n=1 Tax=Lutzomyia longipalpis TaxID=7200 RepID=UPI002483D96D|nr:uncharacterized protein LOC129789018 [Lutzomyia longipalpis]